MFVGGVLELGANIVLSGGVKMELSAAQSSGRLTAAIIAQVEEA